MKVTVLDGYALNPGDLSWKEFEQLAQISIYERTAKDQVIERALGSEALLTNKVVLDRETIEALPDLKYIGVLATGYNVVDTKAAAQRGIIVTNIPSYSTMSVAQMVFAHILNIHNRVSLHSESVHQGKWNSNKDFCFWLTPQIELAGKTIGLFGLGNTGMATARIALAFGMNVIAVTSKKPSEVPQGITSVSSQQLFAQSDIISLHCPLCPDTQELINARTIAMMKPSAILINTGRGPLINESDLAQALNQGKIAAAAMDVLSCEPPKADNPLLSARNCYITPHIAWATNEARARLMKIAAENLRSFISGTPVNKVN